MTKSSPYSDAKEFASRLQKRADELAGQLARTEGQREAVTQALSDAEKRVQQTSDDSAVLDAVLGLLQGMEESFQRNLQRSLAAVASEGLSQVFGEPMEVQIEASTRADMSALNFRLVKADGQEEDIMEGQGGGIVAVVAFFWHVLLTMAVRPALRYLLVLDEPFAHVSPEYRQALAEMVRALCEKLGFQLIMVTQEREYAAYADKAYFFERRGGETAVRPFAEIGEALDDEA